jgi:hypothetical protein
MVTLRVIPQKKALSSAWRRKPEINAKKNSRTHPNVRQLRQKKDNMIYLATWNVQSLFRVNAVKELVNELSWLDCIENDLKSVGVGRWRKKTEDRSVWAIVLKEALVNL